MILERAKKETNFRKITFPQVFSVHLIWTHFCKEKLYLTRLTRDLIYPQRHFLKMRKNKEVNLPACAFHTSFFGQHQESQYSPHKLFSFTLWSMYNRTDSYFKRTHNKINIRKQGSQQHSDYFEKL